jgi:NADPH2:quinone reductase
MRALLVREHGPASAMRVEEVPDLRPGPGEVVVDVHAIGVNYPDLLVIGGTYQNLPPRPFSPGKEAAGVVAAVGEGVTRIRPGTRVSVQVEHGAYAEQVRAPADWTYPLPDGMGFADAAALGLVAQTAHFALVDRGQLRTGETVLVTGAGGGVGLAAVQVAKALGARVLAGVRNEPHAQAVREAGADHVIDLAAPDLRESLRAQVFAATGGKAADVIVDQVGGDVFDAALRAIAWRGRLVVVGFAAGRIPEVRAGLLLVKNIAVAGLQWSDYRERDPDWVRRVQDELFRFHEEGKLRPRIMKSFPLEQAAEALELVKAGKVTGKVVLTTSRS